MVILFFAFIAILQSMNIVQSYDQQFVNLDYELNSYEKFTFYQQKLNIMMIGTAPQTLRKQKSMYAKKFSNKNHDEENIDEEMDIIYVVDNQRMVHEIRDYPYDSRGIIKTLNLDAYQSIPLSKRWPALNSILDTVEKSNEEKTETIMFSLTTSLAYDSVDDYDERNFPSNDKYSNSSTSTITTLDEELGEYYVWVFAFYHHYYEIHLFQAINLRESDGFYKLHSMNSFDEEDRIRFASSSKYNFTIFFEQSFNEQLEPLRARLVTLNQLSRAAEHIIDGDFFLNSKQLNETNNIDNENRQQYDEGEWKRQSSAFVCHRNYDNIFQIMDALDECPNDMYPVELFIIQSFFHGQFLYIFDYKYVYVLHKKSKYLNIFQLEEILRYDNYPTIFRQGSLLCK